MTTMKAVRIHAFGGPEVLVYEDAPKPEPKDGEVLIRIAAAGVNPIDWKTREGQTEQRSPHVLPLILGWDVAGIVDALGPGVTQFAVGDAVFAMAYQGTYAEFVSLPAVTVCPKPASMDITRAASVPLTSTTAWQALTEQAALTGGQRILIHGAGGSIGSFAVQFARVKGATVIATATGSDLDYVRGLGADIVVDYKSERFEDIVKDADAVLDTVGGDTQARSWQTLRDGGRLVTTVGITTDSPEATARGVQGRPFGAYTDGAVLAEVARLMDAGQVKTRIGTVLPLSEAWQAQELAQSGGNHGKVMLVI